MQLVHSKIKSLEANLVAISPQLSDKSSSIAKDSALEFDILSDAGNRIAGKFGLVHTMPEKYRGKKNSGLILRIIMAMTQEKCLWPPPM